MRNLVTCPECRKVIAWPIDNPAGPFCPECGGLISVVDNKPTERAPMLSYADFSVIIDDEAEDLGLDSETEEGKYAWNAMNAAANAIREHYEAKITSGELRVVKKVRPKRTDNGEYGYHCGHIVFDAWNGYTKYCPGCGAQIVKE